MLDISSLSHGNNTAVIADVEDTVLLEDWTEHVLDDDRGRRIGHEARLFMKLLGKEIDSEVTVLASLGGGGNTNDLARTTLKDQEIANADVVAGNRNGVRANRAVDEADALTDTFADAGWAAIFLFNDYLLVFMVVVVRVEGMEDAIGGFLNAVTEGVVPTFIIVVTHLGTSGWVDGGFGFDSYFFFSGFGAARLVFDVVGWLDASAVITLGNVDFFFAARDFDVGFDFCVAVISWFAVAVVKSDVSKYCLELEVFFRALCRGSVE